MNELIEIKWTERLESDLAAFIRDRCQYQPGRPALSALADREAFLAEFDARERTHRRAIAALKELLTRHSQPSVDSDIAEAMGKFQDRVRGALMPALDEQAEPVKVDNEALAERAERARAHAANRTGEGEL